MCLHLEYDEASTSIIYSLCSYNNTSISLPALKKNLLASSIVAGLGYKMNNVPDNAIVFNAAASISRCFMHLLMCSKLMGGHTPRTSKILCLNFSQICWSCKDCPVTQLYGTKPRMMMSISSTSLKFLECLVMSPRGNPASDAFASFDQLGYRVMMMDVRLIPSSQVYVRMLKHARKFLPKSISLSMKTSYPTMHFMQSCLANFASIDCWSVYGAMRRR